MIFGRVPGWAQKAFLGYLPVFLGEEDFPCIVRPLLFCLVMLFWLFYQAVLHRCLLVWVYLMLVLKDMILEVMVLMLVCLRCRFFVLVLSRKAYRFHGCRMVMVLFLLMLGHLSLVVLLLVWVLFVL